VLKPLPEGVVVFVPDGAPTTEIEPEVFYVVSYGEVCVYSDYHTTRDIHQPIRRLSSVDLSEYGVESSKYERLRDAVDALLMDHEDNLYQKWCSTIVAIEAEGK